MKFKRSEVFEMVDALFHKYASSNREEAKEELADMMQRREDASQPAVQGGLYLTCGHGGRIINRNNVPQCDICGKPAAHFGR